MEIQIKENFLHFLWQQGLFKNDKLQSTNAETLQVISTGILNTDSGPDFFNAKIKIDGQLWAGNVEIHVKGSDWYLHNHEKDAVYESIILHVVWENDVPVFTNSNTPITTLVLKDYVSNRTLQNYYKLFLSSNKWINCEVEIHKVDSFLFTNFKERLYFERLEQKSGLINRLLEESHNNWEAVLFKLLAKNFGLKVNGESFLQMANTLDFNVVRKSSDSLIQLEALFLGTSNLFEEEIAVPYYNLLQKEYDYLCKKFNLVKNPSVKPKFFRLRPNNFPTIRLSQLANLYLDKKSLFMEVIQANSLQEFYKIFQVEVSDFWKTHYSFTSTSKNSTKKLTKSFVDLLLINTIIPLKVVYLKHYDKFDASKILALIQQIKPEKNAIIEQYKKLKTPSKNALDSQALLQLYRNYCAKDNCLQCVVGNQMLVGKL